MTKTYTLNSAVDIAEITAFLYAGAIQHPSLGQQGDGIDLDDWGGHTGFVNYCATYATQIHDWLETRQDAVHPGVMVYELIEPMGEWLLEHKTVPLKPDKVLHHFKIEFINWLDNDD